MQYAGLTKLLLIALGGGVGSVLRYLVAGLGQRLMPSSVFPVGTLVVNVLGSLLIGLLAAAFASSRTLLPEVYRPALLVGLLGGFTTFSSFSLETLNLLSEGEFGRAALNIVASVGLALAAVWLGYRLGESWLGV